MAHRTAAAAAAMVPLVPAAARATPALTTLVRFDKASGANPYGGVLLDAAGNLFGVTRGGGANDDGVAFQIAPGSATATTLVTFGNGSDGARGSGSLIADAAGNLYGTTTLGGASGAGAVIRIAAGTHRLTTLASFTGPEGAQPASGVIADAAGNLYGTAPYGGVGGGTVFKYTAATGRLAAVATFPSGVYPYGRITLDPAGNLYGTTQHGGPTNDGTAFEIAAGSTAITTLATFGGATGQRPTAGLTLDPAGNLYGTTATGGPGGSGTVFRIDAATGGLTTLAAFDGTHGAGLDGDLLLDAAGNLYGTAVGGGPSEDGTVFRVDAATRAVTTLVAFNVGAVNGSTPYAGVVADADGNLFGTTSTGENLATTYGTVFKVTNTGFVTPAVAVAAGQTYRFAAGTGPDLTVRRVAGLNVAAGGTAALSPSTSAATRQVLVLPGGLTLAGGPRVWTGRVDVGNNDVVVSGGSLATLTAQAAQGFAGGTWAGSGGLTSAAAAADGRHLTAVGVIANVGPNGSAPLYATFDGQPVTAADVLVRYTLYGDANLDGVVTAADYTRADAGAVNHLTGWQNGDFNYDGTVDGTDYALADNAYNQQAGQIAAPAAVAAAAVPEPAATVALLAAAAPVLLGRRRRP